MPAAVVIGAIAVGTAAYGVIKSEKAAHQAERDAENARNQITAAQKDALLEGPQANAGSLLDRRRLFSKGLSQSAPESTPDPISTPELETSAIKLPEKNPYSGQPPPRVGSWDWSRWEQNRQEWDKTHGH